MNTCDHGHDTVEEVRVLPIGGQGNLILCKKHFMAEMNFRREENRVKFPPSIYWENETTLKNIPHPSAYPIPSWGDLKIYDPESDSNCWRKIGYTINKEDRIGYDIYSFTDSSGKAVYNLFSLDVTEEEAKTRPHSGYYNLESTVLLKGQKTFKFIQH